MAALQYLAAAYKRPRLGEGGGSALSASIWPHFRDGPMTGGLAYRDIGGERPL